MTPAQQRTSTCVRCSARIYHRTDGTWVDDLGRVHCALGAGGQAVRHAPTRLAEADDRVAR